MQISHTFLLATLSMRHHTKSHKHTNMHVILYTMRSMLTLSVGARPVVFISCWIPLWIVVICLRVCTAEGAPIWFSWLRVLCRIQSVCVEYFMRNEIYVLITTKEQRDEQQLEREREPGLFGDRQIQTAEWNRLNSCKYTAQIHAQ